MKLKRFALRGLIVLFVAVALCMFFARTVQTITTPRVQLVQSTSGRFEDKMTFRVPERARQLRHDEVAGCAVFTRDVFAPAVLQDFH